ncbi:MAG: TetR/AcrR family transcriptional regulator [Planctomycetaceae bacterium]|nr:TetR/AcrR family transcriptional regulator [Planctomycetaceae bacterium]
MPPHAAKARRSTPAASQRRLNRRCAIMQAAERLCSTRRFHEVTMDDIATEAGVAKGTLYGYFPDKEELFFQTIAAGIEDLCQVLRQKASATMAFPARLADTCHRISTFYQQRRTLLRMIQTEDARLSSCTGAHHHRWLTLRKGLQSALAELMSEGVADGNLRPDSSPLVLASILMGMLRARSHDMMDLDPGLRSDQMMVDLFLKGAQAGTETSRKKTGRSSGRRLP